MPEVERLRDPIGANRGKSLREHASTLSKNAKKQYHEKYFIPPYRPTNRNWEMTFAALGWKRRTIEKFWKLFCKINHSSGAIQLEHFLDFFDLDWTKWTERCFTYFDTTGGGDIDFLEFMVSVWNVCTFKIDSLSNFTFDMYDLDCDGELSIPEIENMVRELFRDTGGKLCLREATEYAAERGGALNLNAFISYTATHQTLLFPMFQIQRKLQKKVFGVQFWEEIERSSKETYDHTGKNRNEFNPRHVQILLRTYQTGGAVAVLSHTGDPNAGLRDWYENQKQDDKAQHESNAAEESENAKSGSQRWAALRETVQSKAKATQQWGSMKRNILNGTLDRISDLKKTNVGADDLDMVAAASAMGGHSEVKDSDESKRRAIPRHVAERLDRIRAKHRQDDKDSATVKMSDQNTSNQDTTREDPTEHVVVTPARASSIPPDVAERLQRIRAARLEAKKKQVPTKRPRPRARETVIPNNVRQRQVGTIFYKSNDGANSRDWLK
jgi:Ca2+-binding EF-hand superfamily protein